LLCYRFASPLAIPLVSSPLNPYYQFEAQPDSTRHILSYPARFYLKTSFCYKMEIACCHSADFKQCCLNATNSQDSQELGVVGTYG
jgi:hypothetical protein